MWFHFSRKSRPPRSAGRVPLSYKPRIEALEDRCVPSAGALDPTFGNGAGYVITAPTNGGSAKGGEILLQPDGKIVETGNDFLVGKNGKISASDFVAVRYNTDGSLDKSFGTGGIALASSAPNVGFSVRALSAALYPNAGTANDGKIVLEGSYPVQSGKNTPYVNELALVRFNANGSLDTTFGSGGEVLTPFSVGGTNLGVFSAGVVVTTTGQIVECGNVGNASGSPTYTVLARFNANGTLDTTFGQGGKVITPGPGANNLIQEPDGRLVVPASSSTNGVALRYNANGTLDTTFGSGGIVTNAAFGDFLAAAVYPTAGTANDGKIVVVGDGSPNGGWEAARYNPDGTLDSSFGNGGTVNTQTGSFAAWGVVLQADGKIVATGNSFVLVRYNPDGSLDGTFGTGGIVTTTLNGATTGLFRNLALQANGDIVTGGIVNGEFVVARYLPSEPEIGSFTANPNPVRAGSSVTLTASNITDVNPNSTITQVALYLDTNGDGKLEPTTDTLVGYAIQTSPGVWTFTLSTARMASGSYTLFAWAEDNYGVFGDPLAVILQVQ